MLTIRFSHHRIVLSKPHRISSSMDTNSGQRLQPAHLVVEGLHQAPDYAERAKQWAEYQANLAANPEMQAMPVYPFYSQYSHFYAQQEAANHEYQRHSHHRRGSLEYAATAAAASAQQHGHSRFRSDSSDGKGMLAGPASMEAIRPGSPLTWSPASATETSTTYHGHNLYPTGSQEAVLPPRSPIRSQDGSATHTGSQPGSPAQHAIDPAVFSGTPRTPYQASSPDNDATISAFRQQARHAIPFPSAMATPVRETASLDSPLKVIIRSNSSSNSSSSLQVQEPLATPALTFSPACDDGMNAMASQQVAMSPEHYGGPASPSFEVGSDGNVAAVSRPALVHTASDSMLLRPQTAFLPTTASAVEFPSFPSMPAPRIRQASMPAISSGVIPAPEVITFSEAQARYAQQQIYLEQYASAYPDHSAYYYGNNAGAPVVQQNLGYGYPPHARVWSASSSDAASPMPSDIVGVDDNGQFQPHRRQSTHSSDHLSPGGLQPNYPNFAHPGLMRNVSSSSRASSFSAAGYESAHSAPASARSVSPFSLPAGNAGISVVGLGIDGLQTGLRPPMSAPPVPSAGNEWYAAQSGIGATEWHWTGYAAGSGTPLGESQDQLAAMQLEDSPFGALSVSDGEKPIANQSTIRARRNTRSAPYPRASLTTKRSGKLASSDPDKLPAHGKVTKGKSTPAPNHDIDLPLHMLPTKRSRGRRPIDSYALDVDPEAEATTASTYDQLAFSGVTKTGKPKKIFICRVPGCDKCFRRGEHLKRHIKSLHSHDKRKSYLLPFPP